MSEFLSLGFYYLHYCAHFDLQVDPFGYIRNAAQRAMPSPIAPIRPQEDGESLPIPPPKPKAKKTTPHFDFEPKIGIEQARKKIHYCCVHDLTLILLSLSGERNKFDCKKPTRDEVFLLLLREENCPSCIIPRSPHEGSHGGETPLLQPVPGVLRLQGCFGRPRKGPRNRTSVQVWRLREKVQLLLEPQTT